MNLEDFNEEQKAFIQEQIDNSINSEKAVKFLEKQGAKVFMSDGAFKSHIDGQLKELDNGKIESPSVIQKWALNYVDSWKAKTLSMFDQKILKGHFGREREDGEHTIDAISKEIEKLKKGGEGIPESELNAVKTKLQESLRKNDDWQKKYDGLQSQIFEGKKSAFVDKGVDSTHWDYDEWTKPAVEDKVKKAFYSNFEIVEDESGWYVLEKATGNKVVNNQGEIVPPDQVVKNFVGGLENLKIKEGFAQTDKNGAGAMSAEAKKRAAEKFKAEANLKGLMPHQRSYFETAKSLGALHAIPDDLRKLAEKREWV